MLKPVQQCTHCGAGLAIEDLRKPNCTYCGTALPHHAQAAQHAQMIGQVMGQMMQQQAQVQDAWRSGFGLPPVGGPPGGAPPGAPVMGPGHAYGDPLRAAHVHAAGVQTMVRTVAIAVGVVFALAVVASVAIVLLVRAT